MEDEHKSKTPIKLILNAIRIWKNKKSFITAERRKREAANSKLTEQNLGDANGVRVISFAEL